MEEAQGTSLDASWNKMDLEGKAAIINDVICIENKLSSLSFTRYGSIYYKNDGLEGCAKAEVMGDVSEALRKDVESRFVIGPTVEREFWRNERSEMDIDRGPWETPQGYVIAVARREIAWIGRYAIPQSSVNALQISMAQNSPEAHISLLRRFLAVAPHLLPRDASLVASSLWHRDIHRGNLFVKDGQITSLIDWQATWTAPLCLQARQPRLLDHKGEVLLRLPENFKTLEVDEQDRLNKQVSTSILLHVYETQTARRNPLLSSLYRLRHGQTRIQPIIFAGDTWTDDILPLRESLIRVERYWDELDVDVPCPLHFTPEELKDHAKDGEGWNEAQDFWDSVAGLVTPEGWTSNDMFAEASGLFSEFRQNALKNMTGREKESFEAQTRWAKSSK